MKINENDARQILSEYTKLPPDIVKEVSLALQTIELKPEQLQPVIDATVETKLFDTRVNASDLLLSVLKRNNSNARQLDQALVPTLVITTMSSTIMPIRPSS